MTTNLTPKEEDIQIALAELLDLIKYEGRPLKWCHVPNGGKRHIKTAVKMKAAGVKPGIPDIIIFDPPPCYMMGSKGAMIELKRSKGGKVSDTQQEWLDYLGASGWSVAVCKGIDEALSQLGKWGYLKDGKG